MTPFVLVALLLLLVAGLGVAAFRRALPRALLGAQVALAAAGLLALAGGAPRAALALVLLGSVTALVIGAAHLRHRDRDGAATARVSRPGLVLGAFLMTPWLALLAGTLRSEGRGNAEATATATASSGILVAVLGLVAVVAALAVARPQGREDA